MLVFYASLCRKLPQTSMGTARCTCEWPLLRLAALQWMVSKLVEAAGAGCCCSVGWGALSNRSIAEIAEIVSPNCRRFRAACLNGLSRASARTACPLPDCSGVATSYCFPSTVWACPGGGTFHLRHVCMSSADVVSKSVVCFLATGSALGDRGREGSCIMRLMGSPELATSALGTWAAPVLAFVQFMLIPQDRVLNMTNGNKGKARNDAAKGEARNGSDNKGTAPSDTERARPARQRK